MKPVNVGYRLPVLVGNPKGVQLRIAQIGPELQMKVQVPGAVALRRFVRLWLGLGLVELGNHLEMPRGGVLRVPRTRKARSARRQPTNSGC
jgi:hypothetical protein